MPRKKTVPAPKPVPPPPFREVVEVFGEPSWQLRDMRDGHASRPGCMNGDVRVRKYRVTVELVDEPIEDILARLVALWRASDNHHHIEPLRHEAARYGLVLDIDSFGCARKAARRG